MQSGLTLFAFDCSGSVNKYPLYFKTLQSIVDKYYVKDRGDIFFTWDDIFHYKTYEEIQTWIKSQEGYGLTSSELIAQVLKEQGPKIKHLIITTDGYIDSSNVTKSDDLMNALGWKPEYVTVYLIGKYAKDVSVVTPYVRESPHIIYDVSQEETKIIEEVFPHYIKSFNEMYNITSKRMFMREYPGILNYMFSKCRGKGADQKLVERINELENNLKKDPTNIVGCEIKIAHLRDLANGVTQNNYEKTTDASIIARENCILMIKKIKDNLKAIPQDCTFKTGREVKFETKQYSNDEFLLERRQALKKILKTETNIKPVPQKPKPEGDVKNKLFFNYKK